MKLLTMVALSLTLFAGPATFAGEDNKGVMPPPITKEKTKEQEQVKEQEQAKEQAQAKEQEQVKEQEQAKEQAKEQGQVGQQEQAQEQVQQPVAAEQQQTESAGQQTGGEMTANPHQWKFACIAVNPFMRGMRFIGTDWLQWKASSEALRKCVRFSRYHHRSCRVQQCLRVH